jgi:diguanylate cyclase (GGDEF)-like protein
MAQPVSAPDLRIPSMLRGEPDLGPLEAAYRQSFLRDDLAQIIRIGWIYVASAVFLGLIDSRALETSPATLALHALRVLVIAFSVGAMFALRRTASVAFADRLVWVWALIIAAYALYIHLARPETLFYSTLADLIIITLVYIVMPLRLRLRVIPPLLLTVGDSAIIASYNPPLAVSDLAYITLTLLLGNLVGILSSVHLFTYRRRQFVAQREIERLATIDGLTQVLNHRHFRERLEQEFQRFRRYGHALSLLWVDLDYFKRINDTYGHLAGDAVLREFALLAGTLKRESDELGRLGGEEFALLLPETALSAAQAVAERLRERSAQLSVPFSESAIHFTASIGIAEARASDTSADDLMHRADQALYRAKQYGRNQTRVA